MDRQIIKAKKLGRHRQIMPLTGIRQPKARFGGLSYACPKVFHNAVFKLSNNLPFLD